RAAGSSVTTRTGPSALAWRSAVVRARSRAISRTVRASGIRNASATIEVTARETRTSVFLMTAGRARPAGPRRPAPCAGSGGWRRSRRACGAARTGGRRWSGRRRTPAATPPRGVRGAPRRGRGGRRGRRGGRTRGGSARGACRPAVEVEVEAADGQLGGRPGPRGPAQDGREPGAEVLDGERFYEVVVRARVQQPDDLGLVVARRRDDDGDVGDSAQHLQHFRAVEVGQPQIENDDVGGRLRDLPQRVHRGADAAYDVRPHGQFPNQGGPDIRVILDHQNTR